MAVLAFPAEARRLRGVPVGGDRSASGLPARGGPAAPWPSGRWPAAARARAWLGGVVTAGLDQAGLVGDDDGLGPVAHGELGEEVGDVGLDGRVADDELAGDLAVRAAAADQLEHLQLARREVLQVGRVARAGSRPVDEALDQPARDRGCQKGLPGCDRADPGDELSRSATAWAGP